MPVQEVEDRVVEPGFVLRLDGDQHPFGQPGEKPLEPGVVTVEVGGQLYEQRPGLVAEGVHGGDDPRTNPRDGAACGSA